MLTSSRIVENRLAAVRLKRGMSPAMLAEALGISRTQLWRYEAHVAPIPLITLLRCALHLGVRPAQIIPALAEPANDYEPLAPCQGETCHLSR